MEDTGRILAQAGGGTTCNHQHRLLTACPGGQIPVCCRDTGASGTPPPTTAERSGITEPGTGASAALAPNTKPAATETAAGPRITNAATPGPGIGSCATTPAAAMLEPGSRIAPPPTADTTPAICITTHSGGTTRPAAPNTTEAGANTEPGICNTPEAGGVLGIAGVARGGDVRASCHNRRLPVRSAHGAPESDDSTVGL